MVKDITHSWKRKFFKVRDLGPTPKLNSVKFLKKVEIKIDVKEDKHK